MAPTLHRCAGRCPPRGLIRLGAARRRIGVARRGLPDSYRDLCGLSETMIGRARILLLNWLRHKHRMETAMAQQSAFKVLVLSLLTAWSAAQAGTVSVITSFPKELTEAYKKAFEAANPGINPNQLQVGQQVCIPA